MDSSQTDAEKFEKVPVSIGIIEVKGLQRTKPDLIQPFLTPCLQAKTFGALSECLHQSVETMQRLDIFKNINVVLDKIENQQSGHDVKSINGQLFNIGGRAESLNASASVGQHTSAPLNVSFTKPLSGDPLKQFNASIHSESSSYAAGNKYCHSNHGFSTSLKLPSSVFQGGFHELRYSQDWRRIYNVKEDSSPSVRRSAGNSLKSALSHVLAINTRDDMAFPTSGHFFRWTLETAGLLGDVNHVKNDLFGSIHWPLFETSAALSLSIHAGHLLSLGPSKSLIIDRFQMGGPTSVRGFSLNSLGPRDQEDALGGDMALEGGLSLSFPLMPSASEILRGQLFANFGLLGLSNSASGLRQNFDVFFRRTSPNASVGAGILVRLSPTARLELNLAYPVNNRMDAKTPNRGIQVGLGIEFL